MFLPKKIVNFLFLSVFFVFPFMIRADSLILGPADFHPQEEDALYVKYPDYMSLFPSSPEGWFSAPVHLPQGARITSVVVFYDDADVSHDIWIQFFRINAYNNNFVLMANWTTSGTSGGMTSHKISPVAGGKSIDNTGYDYSCIVNFQLGADTDLKLHKVKINSH